jgi:hypothetical protein
METPISRIVSPFFDLTPSPDRLRNKAISIPTLDRPTHYIVSTNRNFTSPDLSRL